MRRFHLVRVSDVTGISGTGRVAEGVEFSDGTVVMRWTVTGGGIRPTTVHHEDIESVRALHGHGGSSFVEWVDQ